MNSSEERKRAEDRIAERELARETLRNSLEAAGYDGPHEIRSGDPMFSSPMFGGGNFRYAICLKCGAVLKLDDPAPRDGGGYMERSLNLHSLFHERMKS